MKHLAIDTSTDRASVCLRIDDQILSKEQINQKTHAQWLLPLINELLIDGGMVLNQLDAIVFGCGPGSFTGLRIACSIAKGLGFAQDLPLIPVSTLGAIVYAVRQQKQYVHSAVLALLDARMQQMYWSYYAPKAWMGEEQVSAVQDIFIPNHRHPVPDYRHPERSEGSPPLKEMSRKARHDELHCDQSQVIAGVGIELYWPDFQKSVQEIDRLEVYPSAAAMIGLALDIGIKPIAAEDAKPIYVRNQVTQS